VKKEVIDMLREEALIVQLSTAFTELFPDTAWDDGVDSTARRVLKYWREFSGEPRGFDPTVFPATTNGMVLVKDIEFVSLCKHHLLPFYGIAHVAYLPEDKMIGLSKIPRMVEYVAKRPQVQEVLTREIADMLDDVVVGRGTAVLVEARHTCLACRGARSHNAYMVTSELTGVFLTSDRTRAEFYSMLDRKGL
jgi:GTP cyclohydrolase I